MVRGNTSSISVSGSNVHPAGCTASRPAISMTRSAATPGAAAHEEQQHTAPRVAGPGQSWPSIQAMRRTPRAPGRQTALPKSPSTPVSNPSSGWCPSGEPSAR